MVRLADESGGTVEHEFLRVSEIQHGRYGSAEGAASPVKGGSRVLVALLEVRDDIGQVRRVGPLVTGQFSEHLADRERARHAIQAPGVAAPALAAVRLADDNADLP